MLSKREILSEIKKGNIKITPFNMKNVSSCSVDLTLGNCFRKFKKNSKKLMVNENLDSSKFTNLIKLKKGQSIELKSGELVLGATLERIKLSKNISGKLDGRSRFARVGLTVHVSSSLVNPESDNVQVLEIINLSPFILLIKPGLKICQISFNYLTSSSSYNGRFKHQKQP